MDPSGGRSLQQGFPQSRAVKYENSSTKNIMVTIMSYNFAGLIVGKTNGRTSSKAK